jgi:hypothetical protein
MLPAGLTGYQGFLLTPEELGELAPLTAEVLTDILPYDAGWVKLSVLLMAFAGIEARKLDGFRLWKIEQAKDQAARRDARLQVEHKNLDPEKPAPAPGSKKAPLVATPDTGGLPPAPGVIPDAPPRPQ